MKNRMSREAIQLDIDNFLLEYKEKYFLVEQEKVKRDCLIYVCRRKGYTLDEIGELVRSVRSTIHKDLLVINKVLDSGKESELRACLVMCKMRFSW